MSNKMLLWGVAGVSSILLTAYLFSNQMKGPYKEELPYYAFDADSNKLTISKIPQVQIASFAFTDQRSEVYTQEAIAGKVVVADYFFVQCPGICKEMGTQLQRVYREFNQEEDVIILSHTSKPEEDTPGVLMAYAQKLGVENHDKWVFLTGNKKKLYEVARNQYHIADDNGDGGTDDFIHTERFVLADQKGNIRGYYDGTNLEEVDKLIADIKKLVKE